MPTLKRVLTACLAGSLIAALTTGVANAQETGGATSPSGAVTPSNAPDLSKQVTFLVAPKLKRNVLADAAKAVSDPNSPNYRNYLSPKDTANKYGATKVAERRLVAAAKKAGLSAKIDKTRLFAYVTGSVSDWQKLVGANMLFVAATRGPAQAPNTPPFNQYGFLNAANTDFLPLPKVWQGVASHWYPDYAEYVPSLDVPGFGPASGSAAVVFPPAGLPPRVAPQNTATPVGATCLTPQQQAAVYSPSQLATALGLSELQKKHGKAAASRTTIVAFAGGYSQTDLDLFAKCFGLKSPKVEQKLGLGVPSSVVSLSPETALDLQTVTWVSRNAESVRFVQASQSATAALQAYAIALTGWKTPPNSISSSYGVCEFRGPLNTGPLESWQDISHFAALVGTSITIASGDLGSSTCQLAASSPSDSIAQLPYATVLFPASLPFVTAVGATQIQLGAGNKRTAESVWNDLFYGYTGNAVSTAGLSAYFRAPWYQKAITRSQARAVPDVVAFGACTPGTAIYIGGKPLGPICGTSQASPLVATGLSLISEQLRAKGEAPIGFANPWLYQVASKDSKAFNDIVNGSSLYPVSIPGVGTNIPGCCEAATGRDAATGVGSPYFDRLARHASKQR
jgi:kumamolisin